METVRALFRGERLIITTCITMLLMGGAMLSPSALRADDPINGRYCYCDGWECGPPSSPNFQRWCCDPFPYNCGCSFFVTGCGET
jgi:hypothetical protein